ncbi:Inosine-5'-monophosphate dehydrogenase [Fundidesulfovibrio magnetotacticus]|uniref:Inosine-5'-monophosphate dehydrogenase n=1 Tax=Fundidesulfovibrio magnetotacticus TaxID=2730080 RepID=A0A6V8M2F3_9BACT|nr:CBS and ACT domain-containing protein [Fundidesulfovibrio magnetotacticus]GFK94625.1 Inosine-5'-monophosphate dehydrogenase [Fundidesulfovibrio magnetotacticus]
MLIRDWMTKDVITVGPETSMMKASKLMRERKISRLPVVDDSGRLLGIVSDRDLKEASPSKATSLDMHELYYLLSEIKVKDIMTKTPLAVKPSETVEKAAVLMMNNNFGGLPVVDENLKVVGIITDSDVFKVLVEITGVTEGGVQLAFSLPNSPGKLKDVLDDLKGFGARIVSVLTSFTHADEGHRAVYIRIQDPDKSVLTEMVDALSQKYTLLYWVRDNLNPIIP